MTREAAALGAALLAAASGLRALLLAGSEFYQPKPSADHGDTPCCGGSREIERRRKRLAKQKESET